MNKNPLMTLADGGKRIITIANNTGGSITGLAAGAQSVVKSRFALAFSGSSQGTEDIPIAIPVAPEQVPGQFFCPDESADGEREVLEFSQIPNITNGLAIAKMSPNADIQGTSEGTQYFLHASLNKGGEATAIAYELLGFDDQSGGRMIKIHVYSSDGNVQQHTSIVEGVGQFEQPYVIQRGGELIVTMVNVKSPPSHTDIDSPVATISAKGVITRGITGKKVPQNTFQVPEEENSPSTLSKLGSEKLIHLNERSIRAQVQNYGIDPYDEKVEVLGGVQHEHGNGSAIFVYREVDRNSVLAGDSSSDGQHLADLIVYLQQPNGEVYKGQMRLTEGTMCRLKQDSLQEVVTRPGGKTIVQLKKGRRGMFDPSSIYFSSVSEDKPTFELQAFNQVTESPRLPKLDQA